MSITPDARPTDTTTRRGFLVRGAALGALLLARQSAAQDSAGGFVPSPSGTSPDSQSSASNLFPMDQGAAKSVRRPPKVGATRKLTVAERDDVEHRVRCQCGCTLDVYTCRTTDFACEVSPAMHRDILALVEGGYGAQEIVDAFRETYGERALMAPTREGFNLVGWAMPFTALAVGATIVAMLVRRWSRRAASVRAAHAATAPIAIHVDATADEMARLNAAVRGEQ